MNAQEILDKMGKNIDAGCRRPLCWALAYKYGKTLRVLDEVPVFWTRKACAQACRALKAVTGFAFVPAACWLRPRARKMKNALTIKPASRI